MLSPYAKPKNPEFRTRTVPPADAAFTLVELLTVIATIGILAGIIIPTVGRVRDTARSTQCMNNIRQLGMALTLYAHDNKNRYPPVYNSNRDLDWRNIIFKNLYSRDYDSTLFRTTVFACPAAMRNNETNISYGMNAMVPRQSSTPPSQSSETYADRIQTPSRTCMLIENSNEVAGVLDAAELGKIYAAQARHRKRYNVVYYDGHARTHPLPEIPADASTDQGKIFWKGL
ncbi:type II secretory pathway, pseudopilin PulG [Opitutaceae bacterium TAV1]|nr:type II secretory pathway, pseudopilin PulG [Opitutaceae bacterium TAV1]